MSLYNLLLDFNFGDDKNPWSLNYEITENSIRIDKVDYYLRYVNPSATTKRKNKGGNSIVFFLYEAQNYNQQSIPNKVIKIAEYADFKSRRGIEIQNILFANEVKALNLCKEKTYSNVIKIYETGYIRNSKKLSNLYFPFYIMEYADSDLKNYLEDNQLSIDEKISLCIEISYGLKQLKNIEVYHRDLKPDNILFVNDEWKIGDLGLAQFRDEEFVEDTSKIIGPRGWLSPEAMNKYLTNNTENINNFDCKIDHQSDIFQLGKVFWYIVQGNAPIGCVRTIDFKEKDIEIYALLRTMLNHSKKKRYKHIDEIIAILKRINTKLLKQTTIEV